MEQDDWAATFESERPRLTALARRLLGATGDAEDAVQDAWLRLQRQRAERIDNLAGWLTTVVGRICLDHLRSGRRRANIPWEDVHVIADHAPGPHEEAVLTEAVAVALSVMLDTLTPAEQVVLVLHDVFAVPFQEVAAVVGKSPDATKMTASRARRKVRGAVVPEVGDTPARRSVVEAFLAAGRAGDLAGLVAALDPDVVLRTDTPAGSLVTVGARDVAGRAVVFAGRSASTRAVLVDGMCGIVSRSVDGSALSLMVFAVESGRIVRIVALADSPRLAALDLPD